MSTQTDFGMLRIRGHVRDVAAIAANYGQTLGDAYDTAAAVAAKAAQVARESGPPPLTLPSDPAKVAAHVKKIAAERVALREAAVVAAEVAEAVERDALRLALDEVPRVLAIVRDSFADAAAEFRDLAATAPHQVTASSTADDSAAHVQLLACVVTLNAAAEFRRRLAEMLGEDVRGEALSWLVLDLEPTASCAEVRQTLADHAQNPPASLADWARVIRLGASIAGPGEAQDRAERFGRAVYRAGLASADGGQLDRSYGEALRLSAA